VLSLSVKRVFDIIVSGFVLLLAIPIMIPIAAAIWITSGRPVLFCQERVGLGFRRFQIYKFRTMELRSQGTAITVGGDKRITVLGRFLRPAKLDELPQLWNVLRGDMSLVGPRPEIPEYVNLFKDRYRKVLTVRPGITDLASLRFRNEEDILERSAEPFREYSERILPLKLDLAEEYVRTHTLLTDVSILLHTAAVIVKGR